MFLTFFGEGLNAYILYRNYRQNVLSSSEVTTQHINETKTLLKLYLILKCPYLNAEKEYNAVTVGNFRGSLREITWLQELVTGVLVFASIPFLLVSSLIHPTKTPRLKCLLKSSYNLRSKRQI